MGGFGSGSNSRYYARTTTANCVRLPMSYLRRGGMLKEEESTLMLRKGRNGGPLNLIIGKVTELEMIIFNNSPKPNNFDTINIEWTPCYFGGERPWFVCPKCYNQVSVLYYRGWFQCRTCHNLPYASTRQTPLTRANNRRLRLKAKLTSSLTGEIEKPKGMHWKTFYRILAELRAYENCVFGAMKDSLDSLYRKKRRFYTK